MKKQILQFFIIISRSKLVLILLFLNLYFIISLFSGKNNLFNYNKLKKEIQEKTTELQIIQTKTTSVKKKSDILNQESINDDQFDEILRSTMNVIKENEKIILIK